MQTVLIFLLITAVKLAVLYFLFKEQKKLAVAVGFLFTVFMAAVFVLLAENTGIKDYVTWPLLVLLECGCYRLYMNCSWKKALLSGLAVNLVFIAAAFLMAKTTR
jgi:hypothetical protein